MSLNATAVTDGVGRWLIAFSLLGLGGVSTLSAGESVGAYSERITSELRAKDPAAAELFDRANQARDRGQWADAERDYRKVLRLEPAFNHATRRLCGVVLNQGRQAEALGLCREALAAADTAENHVQLLWALLQPGPGREPSADELREARAHAQVLRQVPDPGGTTLFPVCQLAIAGKDLAELRGCAERLKSVAPREAPTYFFTWVVAMSDRDWEAAYAALEQARRLGLPEAQYASMKAETEKARGPIPVILRAGVVVLTVWALGLVALLGLGLVLSWVALRVAQRPPTVQTGEFLGLTGGLRSAYRAVLWVSCLYYYISIPIVLAVVVITGGGLIYAFFAMGHVPIKLVALIAIGVLVTIWAALKSLLVRTADEDPGDRLEEGKHPRLQQVLDEVAQQIGTRSVNNVYLTPGTEFAVTERGGLIKQLRGGSERCLILGVGVLDGMKMGPFKAVLAHEYGHFSNRDTAGGGFALTVRRSLLTMAYGLAQGGVAAWYNPAWLFLAGFNLVFLRISQGASRLQEIMADRWAAFAYGAEAFEQGLRHVVERSVRFQAHANSTLREVVDGKLALANLYAFQPSRGPVEGEIVEAVGKLIHAKPSPYDSHPSPVERLALVHSLPKRRSGAGPDAERDAWDLFEDPAVIQCWMTDRVRTNVEKNHGVTIPRAL